MSELPRAILLLAASAALVRSEEQKDSQAVSSPCLSVCQMDEASGLCRGCLRTLQEIARWSQLDPPAKRSVWGQIEQRIAVLRSDSRL